MIRERPLAGFVSKKTSKPPRPASGLLREEEDEEEGEEGEEDKLGALASYLTSYPSLPSLTMA